ncbi:hypothetical protein [Oryza sativa Japonica Group]|uniref:Uncharacterized protein n=1 Tax=Oryza sativa subsp. japonica TaxID=39947 RepID=Q9ASP3_ORYSJ|nr:hypothetical protein [Oryza sativa Japonica Group]
MTIYSFDVEEIVVDALPRLEVIEFGALVLGRSIHDEGVHVGTVVEMLVAASHNGKVDPANLSN